MLGLISSLVWLAALSGCRAAPERDLVVLAAASLTEAFGRIAEDYREDHGVAVHCSFAGSQVLAAQLRAGIEADVVAVANAEIMERLEGQDLVREPVPFASNRLVWVTRRGADAGLERLADPGLRLVLAAPEVPAGRYSRLALRRLGLLDAAEARLVSQELDVKGVVAKLLLGGADAGMTYATDVRGSQFATLQTETLPEIADVKGHYLVATASPSADAERFVAFVLGPRGRARLLELGFGAP